ncbi:hypothetical protein GNI_064020 [Gregarina niphandrodes]|uniref:Uncharacterized protein n=1 Tax=Gregarina niphandrodes TaxID=110365 RepID=A0A023B812_GRENI|nr:hypothetical protein GNI_064020 [Gregarina niphandrodes]EZG68182.1 hypothetical protein GNI_064020 [Gregarina niphandrodes]|eukprot:XP_011130076.1 hypothetical protein GNI_064020 [Gregarina niphandrodes]
MAVKIPEIDPLSIPFVGAHSGRMMFNIQPQDVEAEEEFNLLESLIPKEAPLFALDSEEYQKALQQRPRTASDLREEDNAVQGK